MTTDLTPAVFVKDNAVFANSRDVASYFGKQHAHVLRDISALASKIGGNERAWFRTTVYMANAGYGMRECPAFDMTKDGFTLLVMGYTGTEAMQFKLRYITRFNEMEVTLKTQAVQTPALPQSYRETLLALAAEVGERERVDKLARLTGEGATPNTYPTLEALADQCQAGTRSFPRGRWKGLPGSPSGASTHLESTPCSEDCNATERTRLRA